MSLICTASLPRNCQVLIFTTSLPRNHLTDYVAIMQRMILSPALHIIKWTSDLITRMEEELERYANGIIYAMPQKQYKSSLHDMCNINIISIIFILSKETYVF